MDGLEYPPGKLTGNEEEYKTDGLLDKTKTEQKCDLGIDACQMRIDEMNEVMSDGWEQRLREMLDAPFFEMEQLVRQYCTGDLEIRTHYQKLENTVKRLEASYNQKLAMIGEIDRLGMEGRDEDAEAVKKRII